MTIISAYGGKRLVVAEKIKSFYISGKEVYADEIKIGTFRTESEALKEIKQLARALSSIEKTGQTDIVVS